MIGRLTYKVEVQQLTAGDAVERDGYRVHAFATDHRVPSVGYALVEDERPGRFDIDAARGLGVPEGPMFGLLQHGEAVTLDTGVTIRPDAVVGEARPGRTLVFSGDTRPCKGLFQACVGADVLVHEATFLEEEAERAAETGHTTALQAGRLAREAGVRAPRSHAHLDPASGPRDPGRGAPEFPAAVLPRDFDSIDVPLAERGEPHLVKAA